MKLKIFGLALVIASLSGTASAGGSKFFDRPEFRGNGKPALAAPEIDPASAMSALTMLASGLVIVRGRRSKK